MKNFVALFILLLGVFPAHAAPAAFQQAVRAAQPEIYLSFDAARAEKTLLLHGAPLSAKGQGAAADGALQFDGAAQYASLVNRGFGAALGASSLEFIFKTSSAKRGSLFGIFNEGRGLGLSIDLNTDSSDREAPGVTRFYLRDADGSEDNALIATFDDAEVDIYNDAFHHLLFAFDASAATLPAALRVYVDGEPVLLDFSSRPLPKRFADFGLDAAIAARNVRGTVGGFAALTLDEAAFYQRVLTAAEAKTHAQLAAAPPRTARPSAVPPPLRVAAPQGKAAFEKRAREFLKFVAAHSDNPMQTTWGAYRNFDGYALACMALEGRDAEARRLLGETLDMIDRNFAKERAGGDKWHLADFAIHPLLRAYFKYRQANFPDDPLWTRLEKTAQNFLFHYGDLTENHNMLHLTLRYLVGQTWPDATLPDGRTGRAHYAEAGLQIRRWMRDWVRQGSTEWGADIYYNVNLLALLNLYDFASDPAMRAAAQGLLDLFALDEALDAFAGTMIGAARRSYAVYRMDARQSPARALHYIWFDSGAAEPFNLHFIGGVLEAATSEYLPPPAIVWIAKNGAPSQNSTTHLRGLWGGADYLSKHTLRLKEVMQSTMNSPGGSGRFTEHVWQITMGEAALVFANHPTIGNNKDALKKYAEARPEAPAGGAWYWAYANMPPGHPGDVRPGYWQGNHVGPRSFGSGAQSFLIFNIPDNDALPWAHIYLPRDKFDEVRAEGQWIFLRKGAGPKAGYAALWLSSDYAATTQGIWANAELKLNAPRAGIFSFIGNAPQQGDFEKFISAAKARQPQWDAATLTLSALSENTDERLSVSYEGGAAQAGRKIEARGARFATPWGAMKLGSTALHLQTPGGAFDLDLRGVL